MSGTLQKKVSLIFLIKVKKWSSVLNIHSPDAYRL